MPHTISRGYVILLILAAVALGVCVPQPAPTDTATSIPPAPSSTAAPVLTKLPPLEDWPYRWLKGIPCRPPCWEGVTPGQTTAEEAVEILRRSPIIATANTTTLPVPNPEMGLVVWSWVGSEKEQGGQALFHAQTPSSPVYVVDPYLPVSFKLGDVIQAYGEPSHVVARVWLLPGSSDAAYDLSILYLSQGFLLTLGDQRMKPPLSMDTHLEHVLFFAPGDEGLRAVSPLWDTYPGRLASWQGMKDFDFYCQATVGTPCP